MLLRPIIEAYLRHAQAINLYCPEALAERLRILGKFADVHGALDLAECRRHILADWIESDPKLKSSSTRKARANIVNACFNWSVREGRIPSNPFRGVNYPEADPRPCFEDGAFEAFLRAANKRLERAGRFLRYTSCRLSDLCRATWPDVDPERGIIVLNHHKSRNKTRKPKVIALVPEAIELLIEVRQEQDSEYMGEIFLNNCNRPWNRRTLGQNLRRMKKAGKVETPATLHGIRHNAATQAVRNGARMKFVSLMLGHASQAITEKYYVHVSEDIDGILAAAELAQKR